MAFRIKQTRWLYISFSILSLCLAFTITPVKALPPITTPVLSSSQPHNWLEQGRNLYSLGRFAEALTAWQTAMQQYQASYDRINEALSLSYRMALRKGRRQMAEGRRRGKEKQITKNDLAY